MSQLSNPWHGMSVRCMLLRSLVPMVTLHGMVYGAQQPGGFDAGFDRFKSQKRA